MFFEVNENGKIMICAEAKIKPNMIELSPPAEFIPDEMHNWRVTGGEFVYSPEPVPPVPVPDPNSRIAELEAKLMAYEAAYLEGVNEA